MKTEAEGLHDDSDAPPAKRQRVDAEGQGMEVEHSTAHAEPGAEAAAGGAALAPTLGGTGIEELQNYLHQIAAQHKGGAQGDGSAAAADAQADAAEGGQGSQQQQALNALLASVLLRQAGAPGAAPGDAAAAGVADYATLSALLTSQAAGAAENGQGAPLEATGGAEGAQQLDLTSLLASALVQASQQQAAAAAAAAATQSDTAAGESGAAMQAEGEEGEETEPASEAGGIDASGSAQAAAGPDAGAAAGLAPTVDGESMIASLTQLLHSGGQAQGAPAGNLGSSTAAAVGVEGDGTVFPGGMLPAGDALGAAGADAGIPSLFQGANLSALQLAGLDISQLAQLMVAQRGDATGLAAGGLLQGLAGLGPGTGAEPDVSEAGMNQDYYMLPEAEDQEPMMRCEFQDEKTGGGMKLNDGRIYVPLQFIIRNFNRREYPVQTSAELCVNGEMIKEDCPVKIARSQNKTRRHGLGNHWITGHQRFIKNLKDVRLISLELVPESEPGRVHRLRINLSSAGSWADTPAPVLPPVAPRMPSALPLLLQAAALGLPTAGGAAAAPGQVAGGDQQVTQLLLQQALTRSTLQLPGAPAPAAAEATPGGANPLLSTLALLTGANPASGVVPGEGSGAEGGADSATTAGAAHGAAEATGLGAAATHALNPAADGLLASMAAAVADVSDPAGSSQVAQEGLPQAGQGPLDAAAAAALAAAAAAASAAEGEAGSGAAESATGSAPADGAAHTGEQQAQGGLTAALSALSAGPSAGVDQAHATAAAATAAAAAALSSALEQATGHAGGAAGSSEGVNAAAGGAQGSGSSSLPNPDLLGLLGVVPSLPLPLLATLPPEQQAALLMSSAPLLNALNPQQQQSQQQANLAPLAGLLQLMGGGAGGLAGLFPGLGAAGAGSPLQREATGNYPRLYDGRIHVPLNIIQTHFATCEFPLPITTCVFVNSTCIGATLQARIVRYKKHKRPNHFNFWITGLQKELNKYNDVRQAGVQYEADGSLRINLLAAN